MASVIEPIFFDCEEKLSENDSLKEFTREFPILNVKTEQEESEEPISETVEDIILPVISKIESVQVKPERVFYNSEDNVIDEECSGKLDKDTMSAIGDINIPVITKLDHVEIKDEASLSAYDDNITIDECCVEKQLELRNKLNHEKQTKQKEASRELVLAEAGAARHSVRAREHSHEHTDVISRLHREDHEDEVKTNINNDHRVDGNECSNKGAKQYKCDECMKCFTQKGNLNVHYRTHTGEKPFKCDVCMKCYRHKNNLNVHHRIHTDEKPYKCYVCMKCFAQKNELKAHYSIHDDDKPYMCDVCMKSFNSKGNLKVHYRIHTGEKPYKCDVCMKCFERKSHLTAHHRIRTEYMNLKLKH